MIVYDGLKTDFLSSCENDSIAIEIEENILRKIGRHTAKAEFRSWENSLNYMYKVLNDRTIPSDAGVAIEYNIPQTSKRVDFMISGYNASVQDEDVQLHPCACLHNYIRHTDDPLDARQYKDYLDDAPAYTKGQLSDLRAFIKKSIVKGDKKDILYLIDHGKIRPSKSLQNAIASMLKGNREFIMIDDQKIAYEEILRLSGLSLKDGRKRTIIVQGGPGTGKTVIAVNLLAELTMRNQVVQYVSKNSAPRQVYLRKLKGEMKKSSVDNLFKVSGTYTETGNNVIYR